MNIKLTKEAVWVNYSPRGDVEHRLPAGTIIYNVFKPRPEGWEGYVKTEEHPNGMIWFISNADYECAEKIDAKNYEEL